MVSNLFRRAMLIGRMKLHLKPVALPFGLLLSLPMLLVLSPWAIRGAENSKPIYLQSDGRAGVLRYTPGHWGMISVSVGNPSDKPVKVLSTMFFEEDPQLQYGREIWIPARAKRITWYPILPPADYPTSKQSILTRSLLLARDSASSGDTVLGNSSDRIYEGGMLPCVGDGPLTAIISDANDIAANDLISTARQTRDLSITVPALRSRILPLGAETLESLDHLVISSDWFAAEDAATSAISQWVHDGGHLWIMLDQVKPATVSALLGDAYRCHVVDRVGLMQLQIKAAPGVIHGEESPLRTFEKPVDVLRVVGPDIVPAYIVNGWPAAFWQTVGRGRVLFTTVGARAWYRPVRKGDVLPRIKGPSLPFTATKPLAALSVDFMEQCSPALLPPEELNNFVTEHVGYQIVGRGVVIFMLVGFCLALLGLGIWLASREQLQHLGWIGPSLALVTACVLFLIGSISRHSVPTTVSVAQIVVCTPGHENLHLTGLAAIYNQKKMKVECGAQNGGIISLDMTGLEGTTRRMVRTDLDKWHWENLTFPAGVRLGSFSRDIPTKAPPRATATFGPEGIVGQWTPGLLTKVEDPIIITPIGRSLAAHFQGEGRFVSTSGDVLAPDQLLSDSVLTTRQRRRQQLFRRLMVRRQECHFPDRPTLLVWAAPLDLGFKMAEQARQVGGAMIAIPLEFQRPDPETHVVVPSPLLPFVPVPFPGEAGRSPSFDMSHHVWIGPLTESSRIMLRFQCPKVLLPFRCESARLRVDIRAPSRNLELFGLQKDKPILLDTHKSPVGTIRFTIDKADLLTPDSEGCLYFGLDVSDVQNNNGDGGILAVGWQIEEVQLEISGTTASP